MTHRPPPHSRRHVTGSVGYTVLHVALAHSACSHNCLPFVPHVPHARVCARGCTHSPSIHTHTLSPSIHLSRPMKSRSSILHRVKARVGPRPLPSPQHDACDGKKEGVKEKLKGANKHPRAKRDIGNAKSEGRREKIKREKTGMRAVVVAHKAASTSALFIFIYLLLLLDFDFASLFLRFFFSGAAVLVVGC
ncbi:hypothetical protein TRSC58_07379 [Trypanosoma rangeli SC58]|uniref:Uncharacterized protein n=1 Tax=Trypanosoma rangeli SC58 TaxID=429131 RepID=A0A061ITD1_TRYRA|nr:hypothetical protein TRSC58_07379 [Trypanosoma rangeli SC58]